MLFDINQFSKMGCNWVCVWGGIELVSFLKSEKSNHLLFIASCFLIRNLNHEMHTKIHEKLFNLTFCFQSGIVKIVQIYLRRSLHM